MSHLTAKLAQTAPDEIGLADDKTQLSWSVLDDQLNRAANALIGMEFGPEDRVAVFARNSVEAILAYQAALHAGLSSVPVNSHFTVDELAYILENSGSKIVFVDAYTAQTALDAAKISGGATVIGWRCESIEGVKSWEEMLAAAGPEQPSGDCSWLKYDRPT